MVFQIDEVEPTRERVKNSIDEYLDALILKVKRLKSKDECLYVLKHYYLQSKIPDKHDRAYGHAVTFLMDFGLLNKRKEKIHITPMGLLFLQRYK